MNGKLGRLLVVAVFLFVGIGFYSTINVVFAKGGTTSASGWERHFQDNDECEYGKKFKRDKRNKWKKKCVCLQKETPGKQQEGNININGTVIATKFVGDGSLLTGIGGSSADTKKGLTVGGGQVFDSTVTTQTTWTTLDLSSVVGANHAFVILRVNNISLPTTTSLAFRQKGDTKDYDANRGFFTTNTTIIIGDLSASTQAIIYTDSNGQIEMKADRVISGISIDVVLYIL